MTSRYGRQTLELRLDACGEALARLRAQPPSTLRDELIGRLERERARLLVAAREAGEVVGST